MIRIGINGFGRIGRTLARVNQYYKRFELVVVNDINPHMENMVYLFKHDSTYGNYEGKVSCDTDCFEIDGQKVNFFSKRNIAEVPWDKYGVDCVIDSSGVSDNVKNAKALVEAGKVKKVIVTHSSGLVDKEVVVGVNDNELEKSHHVVSNSICDANAIAHVLSWINQQYGIKTGSITTVHPWLSYQNLVDGASKSQITPGMVWTDFALGRASVNCLIPKNTTAVSATEKILPTVKGKLASFSYRVPTDIVSSSDVTIIPDKVPSSKELISFIEGEISKSKYVTGNKESLVSVDYKKNPSSAIIDLQWLNVHNGVIKCILWYDNEWGYSCRALDLVEILLKK